MEIGLYIADLLGEQDEVSVPGLGTFIKIRNSGTFDQISNSFKPPYFKFGFKYNTSGSYPISEYINLEKGVEIESVDHYIKKFASNILEQINEQNKADIKGLGILYREDGIIHFEPSAELQNSGVFYGLKPQLDIFTTHSSELILEKRPEQTETDEENDVFQDYTEKSSGSNVFMILVLIFLGLISVAVTLYFTNQGVKNLFDDLTSRVLNRTEIVTDPKTDISPITPDSLPKSVDSLSIPVDSGLKQKDSVNKVIQELSPAIQAQAQVKTENTEEIIDYEIIGAAFALKSEADAYIKVLASKGINAKIAENMPGKMVKISLGSFKDEESAQIQLIQIQKRINKDAWIARVKQQKNSK